MQILFVWGHCPSVPPAGKCLACICVDEWVATLKEMCVARNPSMNTIDVIPYCSSCSVPSVLLSAK